MRMSRRMRMGMRTVLKLRSWFLLWRWGISRWITF